MTPEEQAEQSTRNTGRAMMIGGWLLLLALLSYFFSGVLDQQHNPNGMVDGAMTREGVREVVLQRNRMGHYVSDGRINDQGVEFMLDTGATDVSIPGAIAERLQLKRGRAMTYNTANGNIRAYLTFIDELQLGNISLQNVRASINPHSDENTILLGMSFLKNLEFTQRGDTLILRQYPPEL